MPIVREYHEQGDFRFEEGSVRYDFFIAKAIMVVYDEDECQTEFLALREHDTHGIMSWTQHEKCWTPFTEEIQLLYQGWKAEQALLK